MRPVARSTASACATSSTVRRWRASPSLLSTRCSSASSSISVGFVAEPALLVGERALRELAEIVVGERLEPEQRAAREQRTGEREERVLGGRADEHEQTLLDEREQHVLLRAGEAVHLVEEEDRALAALAEPGPGPLGDLAHVLHARADRGERLERLGAHPGDEPGDRGLAGARRTPEHERRQPVGLDEDPQRLARPEQVLLADDLVERPGPQPRRERRPAREPLLHRRREQIRPRRHYPRRRLRRPTPHQIGAVQALMRPLKRANLMVCFEQRVCHVSDDLRGPAWRR